MFYVLDIPLLGPTKLRKPPVDNTTICRGLNVLPPLNTSQWSAGAKKVTQLLLPTVRETAHTLQNKYQFNLFLRPNCDMVGDKFVFH